MKKLISAFKKLPKRTLINLIITFGCAVLLIVVFLTRSISFGWYLSNNQVSSTGMGMSIMGDEFDIYIENLNPNGNEYDKTTGELPVYVDNAMFKENLSSTAQVLSTAPGGLRSGGVSIAFELVNELEDTENHTKFLLPGSYGTITFYIIPKASAAASTYDINISLSGYKKNANTNSFDLVTDSCIDNLTKGHFLFFKDRSGNTPSEYIYKDLIENSVYTASFNSSNLIEKQIYGDGTIGCYKVTLYWIWALRYSSLYDETKYQYDGSEMTNSEVFEYLDTYSRTNWQYFFYQRNNVNPYTSGLTGDNLMALLDDEYNDGDQKIGDLCDYMAVRLRIYESYSE